MGNLNSIPVLSQVKSLVQVIVGDVGGARETQEDFIYNNTFPVISQVSSAVYAAIGELEKAEQLQKEFAEGLLTFVDGIPGVGHVKGMVHYSMGDVEKGNDSMKASTRALGVIAGGAGGMLTGGPIGAIAGGIGAGAAMDAIINTSEVIVNGENAKFTGYGETLKKIVDAAEGYDTFSVDDGFEAILHPVLDGARGFNARRMLQPSTKTSSRSGNAVAGDLT